MEKKFNANLAPMGCGGYDIDFIVKNPVTGEVSMAAYTHIHLTRATGLEYEAQRLIITDETPYQDIKGGYVLCPDGVSVANVIGYESDLKKYWCVVSGAKCLIDGSDYKKVIATYPNIPDVYCVDLSDVRRWVKSGCNGEVWLKVETHVTQTSNKEDTFPIRTYYDYLPSLTNNTVKMVWVEPYVDERQYLREDREYNKTGYCEEDDEDNPVEASDVTAPETKEGKWLREAAELLSGGAERKICMCMPSINMSDKWQQQIPDSPEHLLYPLFKYMEDAYGMTLLQDELSDIVNVVIGTMDKNGLLNENPLAVICTMCLKRLNKEQFLALKQWVDSYHPVNWHDIADKYYKQDVPNMTGEVIFNWFKDNVNDIRNIINATVPQYKIPEEVTVKDCMSLSEKSGDVQHNQVYPAGKTAMQVAIEQIVAKKQEMQKLYAEETNETGKDQIAQTNMGLSMALTILQSQLPAQRQQIEMAHMQGNKVGFQEGTNSYKGIKVKTTALQDAQQYYSKTYPTE